MRGIPGTIAAPTPPARGPVEATLTSADGAVAGTLHRRPRGGWWACIWDPEVPVEGAPGAFVGASVHPGRPEAMRAIRHATCERCGGRPLPSCDWCAEEGR